MTSTDGDIDSRAEAIRNLWMAENDLAGGSNLARAVRIEMHARIAAVWCALTPACAEPVRPAAHALPETPRRHTGGTASQIMGAFHQARRDALEKASEPAPAPVPAYVPGQQWRDIAGDVWTAVGYLDRGDVLVASGDPDDLADWPNASPVPEVNLYTFNHVYRKWGPLDEIQPSVDKETSGE